jgi:hypothetical protein
MFKILGKIMVRIADIIAEEISAKIRFFGEKLMNGEEVSEETSQEKNPYADYEEFDNPMSLLNEKEKEQSEQRAKEREQALKNRRAVLDEQELQLREQQLEIARQELEQKQTEQKEKAPKKSVSKSVQTIIE